MVESPLHAGCGCPATPRPSEQVIRSSQQGRVRLPCCAPFFVCTFSPDGLTYASMRTYASTEGRRGPRQGHSYPRHGDADRAFRGGPLSMAAPSNRQRRLACPCLPCLRPSLSEISNIPGWLGWGCPSPAPGPAPVPAPVCPPRRRHGSGARNTKQPTTPVHYGGRKGRQQGASLPPPLPRRPGGTG